MKVVAELLEFIIVELCSIIGYDGVEDSISTYDVLINELLDLCAHLCFNPLSKVVDSHYCVLHTTSPFWKSVDYVDSLYGKWPRASHGRKFLWMSFRYPCKLLALVVIAGLFHVVCLHGWPVVALS